MDYGFAPGGTGFDKAVLDYLTYRPQSTVLQPATKNVAAFIEMVRTSPQVQRPVSDLSLGCHGLSYGILQIPFDATSGTLSDINDVQRVQTSHALEMPANVFFPRPTTGPGGLPLIPVFRIVGCSVGAARPFLAQLVKALGGLVVIVATTHLDMEVGLKIQINGQTGTGVLRALTYEFNIFEPVVLEGQLDVIEAFDQKHLTFLDGKAIPRAFWKKHIPTDVFMTSRKDTSSFTFSPKLGGVLASLPLAADQWQHVWEPVGPFKVTPATQNLASTTARREFIRGQLLGRPEFAAGHVFPLHVSRGYPTFNAFIDGYDWLEMPSSKEHWRGYRNVYTVRTPVTLDSTSDEITYDWVDSTNTFTHLGLDEFDSRLFVRVV